MAILGSESFYVTEIDPDSVKLGGTNLIILGSAKAPNLAYSNEDGLPFNVVLQ